MRTSVCVCKQRLVMLLHLVTVRSTSNEASDESLLSNVTAVKRHQISARTHHQHTNVDWKAFTVSTNIHPEPHKHTR